MNTDASNPVRWNYTVFTYGHSISDVRIRIMYDDCIIQEGDMLFNTLSGSHQNHEL